MTFVALPFESTRHATPRVRCALALVIVASFALISSVWSMSYRFQLSEGLQFHEQDKRMELRQSEITSTSALGFLLLATAGAVAATMRPLRPTRWTHPVVVACLCFALWCALSIVWAPNAALSMRKIAILALFLTGMVGMARLIELQDLCWVAALSCVSFLALGLLAEISQGTFHPWQAGYRFCGTFHPNDQGLQCALLILASIFLMGQQGKHVWLARCLLAGGCGGLLLTKSRTALATLMCALLLGMLLRARGWQRYLLASSLVALGCLGILGYSFLPVGSARSAESATSLGRTGDLDSMTGRIPLWQELLDDVGDHPWLGHGYGSFWSAKHIRQYSEIFAWQIPNAHNAYLDLTLSVGLVGLGLYLFWVVGALLTSIVKHESSGQSAELFVSCLITFCIVHGFAESKFPFPGMSSAFVFLAVLVLTARSLPEASRNNARPSRAHAMPPHVFATVPVCRAN